MAFPPPAFLTPAGPNGSPDAAVRCTACPRASARACTHLAGPVRNPSPPFRGERKGPTPQAWEGEVGGRESGGPGPSSVRLRPVHAEPALAKAGGQALGARFRGHDEI